MLTKLVKPGDWLEVNMLDRIQKEPDEEKRIYSSKVYDILSDEQLEIMMPMEQSKYVLLPVDGECELCFYTQNGLYQCMARVVDRYKDNNVYMLLMELMSPLQKHQRREYYRYSCILPVKVRALIDEELEALNRGILNLEAGLPLKQCTIVDISGGGIRFVGRCHLERDSYIFINYEIPIQGKNKSFELVGKVLKETKIQNQPGEYEHRVQYVGISRENREEIIRFIFEEERKNRKKEKG